MKLVVKLGGEVVRSPQIDVVAHDVAALVRGGAHRVVMVHGGGPQASDLQKRLGQTPHIVAGRRVTDEPTLEVMKMAVAGQVNVDLCARLVRARARPVGLHGASALAIRAVKRPPSVVTGGGPLPLDLGLVGDVAGINCDLLELLSGHGYVPVLACLGADEQGGVYNINADKVANEVGAALSADALVLVTDVQAVLSDVGDPASRMARLTVAEAREAIAQGIVRGGMIPKLEESFAGIGAGIPAIHILGRLSAGELLRAVTEPGSVGTLVVA